ncbi:MAG: AbiH family protein [Methylococcales bacterium]|nr:AbiH family protein [Methylococcales bacterium]
MASHVFVIGNGFDLNLGLKTSYQDFIASEHFQNHIGKAKPLFEHLNTKHELQKWVDIEHELGIFSNTLAHYRDVVQSEYKELCASLLEYISTLDFDRIDKGSAAYSLIKNEFNEETYVINFNYTHSIQSILKEIGMSDTVNDSVHHIHGSVSQKNIVFGVDDGIVIYGKHSFLRKSTSHHYGEKNVDTILGNATELTFFGHSLGSTDHMYFKSLFSNYLIHGGGNKKLNFYYYDEAGWNELHEQLHVLTTQQVSKMKVKNPFKGIDVCKAL